jgi:cell division septation protein DedD
VLGSRDLWGDTRRLLEFGFDGQLPPEIESVRRTKGGPGRGRTLPATRVTGRHGSASTRIAPTARAERAPQYAVHVGTFAQKDRAQRLQRALGRRGFDVAIAQVADGRGKARRVRYRVQAGPYQNRGQAESAARTMATEVDLPTRVVQR